MYTLENTGTSQSGVMLLEALIAILIFSLGILGVVGLQASAISSVHDAKFRTDAGLLANELIGQMWAQHTHLEVGGVTPGQRLRTAFEGDGDSAGGPVTDGARFTAWKTRVNDILPGVAGAPPTVVIGRASVCDFSDTTDANLGVPELNNQSATSTRVCVTVRWQTPKEATPRSYRVVVDLI